MDIKRLKYLAMAALLVVPLAACDDDDDEAPTEPAPIVGTVSGQVSVESTGVDGVSVTLSSGQTTTTDGSGNYSFSNVPAGTYVVSISDFGTDVTFGSTSKPVTINSQGQTATIDFNGNFIRTASISGRVIAGTQGVPSVTVTLSGDDSQTDVTNATGEFEFTGLRAGSYTVTISDLPAGADFNSTTRTVTVNTGQSREVDFVGNAESTATVAISSLTNAAGAPLNPAAVAGIMNVTLSIEPGNDIVETATITLGGQTVYTQTFGTAAAQGDEGAPFTVTAQINTAALTGITPNFANGTYTLNASITSQLGDTGTPTAVTSTQITTANANFFVLQSFSAPATAVGGAGSGATGQTWVGGPVSTANPISVTVGYVDFLGDPLTSATMTFTGNAAVHTATFTNNVGTFIFDAAGGNSIAGFTTTPAAVAAGGDAFQVTAGLKASTANLGLNALDPALPAVTTRRLVDTENPVAGALVLTAQSSANACCSNNWTNPGYGFAAGKTGQNDNATNPGVGGVAVTYHTGAAATVNALASAAAAAALPNTPTAGAITGIPTTTNTALNVAAVVTDLLGNRSFVVAAGAGVNPLNSFGVDVNAPTHAFIGGATANQTVYNIATGVVSPAVYSASATDDLAGFSATPYYVVFTRRNPNSTTTCLIGVGAGCAPLMAALGQTPAVGADGHYRFTGFVRDQGGLAASPSLFRELWIDQTPPFVSNIVLPTANPIPGGSSQQFSAVLGDAFHLGTFEFGLVFGGIGETLPFSPPQVLGTPFDGNYLTSQAVQQTINMVVSVEQSAAAGAGALPNGAPSAATAAQFLVQDAAGNPSSQNNPFAAGTIVPAAAVAGFAQPAAADVGWGLTTPAAATNLCNGAGATCPSPANTSAVTLTVQATGASGTFANPFAGGNVFFMFDDAVVGRTRLIGSVTGASATVTDDGTTRTWTWTFSWDPQGNIAAQGPVNVFVVGVTSGGAGVQTLDNAQITIVVGS